jgi:hypothetical protein
MKILKSQDFSHRVSEIIFNKNCTIIEAILIYCDENDVEYSQVRRLISEDMRAAVENEARTQNLLKRAEPV